MIEPSMKRVAVLPWPNVKGAYLCVSGKQRPREMVGDKWYAKNGGHREYVNTYANDRLRSEPCITFTYEEDGIAAEWDGAHGPIQLWWKSHEGFKEGYDEAQPHWLWPWAIGRGHWSQMAVEDECLPQRFVEGDYDAIFSVLRYWVRSRLEERNLEPTDTAQDNGAESIDG